jgi:hypothetical protein
MAIARERESSTNGGISARVRRHRLGIGVALIVIGWLLALYAVFPKTKQETYTDLLVAEGSGRNTYVFVMLNQDTSSLMGARLSLVPLDSSGEFVVTVSVGNNTITLLSDQQLNVSLVSDELTIALPESERIVYRYELVFSLQDYHPQTDIFIALGGLMLSVAGLYLASHPIMARFGEEMKNKNRGRGTGPPP